MANIDQDLQAIMEARYGRDVRQSIHDAIRDINVVADEAHTVAVDSQESAYNSAQAAAGSASDANISAAAANNKSVLSESWAVGGTGTREGEDTNNAEYWAHQAEGAVAGVSSFNGRSGAVTPAQDDYTISQIKATGTQGQVPTLNAQGKLEMQTPSASGTLAGLSDTDITTPSNNQVLKYDSTSGKWKNQNSGESGGHTIEDQSGTAMTQRTGLQFVDAHLTDDSINDGTKVELIKKVTKNQLDNLPANSDGLYRTIDEADDYITASNMLYRTGKSTKQVVDSIEGSLANIENGATSESAYVKGQYIMHQDKFYEVQSAIAIDDAFDDGVNGNIEEKSIGEVLTQLNSKLDDMNCGRGSVEITAGSSETYSQALSRLYNACDTTKISSNSKIELEGEYFLLNRIIRGGTIFVFSRFNFTDIWDCLVIDFKTSGTVFRGINGNITGSPSFSDLSTRTIAYGTSVKLLY